LNSQATPPQPQTGNAQTWLLAQQDSTTGSWHSDPLVTAQVIAVLPAAAGTQLTDTDHDGIPDLVEAALGSNQNVADARNQVGSPTQAVAGVTTTSFAVGATSGLAFTYSLGSGTSFALVSGSLPPGLSLNSATGQISGTPTQSGSYSFEYQTANALLIGRIDVVDATVATNSNADVPLPLWAVLALGGGLIGLLQRKRVGVPTAA
jgi:hypothetical protein